MWHERYVGTDAVLDEEEGYLRMAKSHRKMKKMAQKVEHFCLQQITLQKIVLSKMCSYRVPRSRG